MKSWSEPELRRRCASLDRPVLIVHGLDDPRPAWAVDPPGVSSPRAETVVMEDVGHLPWLEAPEEFYGVLRRFLVAVQSEPARGAKLKPVDGRTVS